MKHLRAYWNVSTGVFVVLFLTLMVSGPFSLFHDPGTFWHIRVGELILDSGSLIHADPFSSTFRGSPWIASQWLAECFIALLYRIDGLDTILLATATTLAALFAWLAGRISARRIQWPVNVLLLTMCLAASSYHFLPRPHLATIFLLAWVFARLGDFEAGRIPLSRLYGIVPVFALWANLHGGVLAGLITLGFCAGCWTLEAVVGRRSPIGGFGGFAGFALLVLLCAVAVVVGPYGIELPETWFTVMSSPVLPQLIIEHAPIDLADPAGQMVAMFGFVYLAACAGVPLRRFRATWLVPIVWFLLACTRIRHGPLFAVTATLALAEMYPHVRWINSLIRRGSELLVQTAPADAIARARFDPRPMILPLLLVATSLAVQFAHLPLPVLGHGWVRLDPQYWPVEMLPELEAYEREHPPGTPVFNEMLFGGFLIQFTPGLGVFIDDRCELYGNDMLVEYAKALGGKTDIFDEWTARYGYELAITASGSTFDSYLRRSGGWEVVKESGPATLFRRRGPT